MNGRKKIVLTAIIIALLSVCVGCGSNETQSQETNIDSTTLESSSAQEAVETDAEAVKRYMRNPAVKAFIRYVKSEEFNTSAELIQNADTKTLGEIADTLFDLYFDLKAISDVPDAAAAVHSALCDQADNLSDAYACYYDAATYTKKGDIASANDSMDSAEPCMEAAIRAAKDFRAELNAYGID